MARVEIKPLPESRRKFSMRFMPMTPPIFPDGPPTEDDIELARELFLALDELSQMWYRRSNPRLFGDL